MTGWPKPRSGISSFLRRTNVPPPMKHPHGHEQNMSTQSLAYNSCFVKHMAPHNLLCEQTLIGNTEEYRHNGKHVEQHQLDFQMKLLNL